MLLPESIDAGGWDLLYSLSRNLLDPKPTNFKALLSACQTLGQCMRNVAIPVAPQQMPAGRKEHGLFTTELPHQRYVATSRLIAATLFQRYINIKYEHGTSMHSEVLLDNGPIYPGALHGGQAPERPPKPHAPWPSKERPWGLPR